MWLRRRDPGGLGAPRVGLNPRWSWGLLTVIAILAAYIPLFGLSLLGVWLVERCVLGNIPGLNVWLGLQTASPLSTEVAK